VAVLRDSLSATCEHRGDSATAATSQSGDQWSTCSIRPTCLSKLNVSASNTAVTNFLAFRGYHIPYIKFLKRARFFKKILKYEKQDFICNTSYSNILI
jgi:hypothetical protein